ncbi:MAG: CoA transferase, partial [Chloroflexi bacterium]|nr:CoA transferase [Chloroflexota bacterium]
MPDLALAGVTVLDLSLNVGGVYCTKLLADLGADVIAIEPLDGHPVRRLGPFSGGQPHSDTGGMFQHLFSNKSTMALDLADPGHRQRVLDLAQGANILVESFQPGELAKLGLHWEALRALQPSLVYTSLTHFGQTGRYRDWQGEEIVDWALGGYMYFGGSPAREPLMVPHDQAMFHAGAQAAVATLAALRWSQRTGRGQQVDVSAVETVLSAHLWTVAHWTHAGKVMRRAGSEVIRCKDGWVRFLATRFDPMFFILMDRPDLVDDPRFVDRPTWTEHAMEVLDLLREWCLGQKKEDIFRRGQSLRIPVTPVYDAADLAESPELRERDWFLDAGKRSDAGIPRQAQRDAAESANQRDHTGIPAA